MVVLEVAVAALAMVLVVSGVLKVRDPDAAVPMLEAIGVGAGRPAVYALAGVEVVVGAAALVVGGRVASAVLGLAYLGFAAVGAVVLRSGAAVPCGCFGRRSAAMTPWHVGVDLVAGAVALLAAALGVSGLYAGALDGVPALVAATVVAVALAAAVVALLTAVPTRADRAGRGGGGGAPASLGDAARAGTVDVAPATRRAAGSGRLPATIEGPTATGEPALVEVAGSGRVTLLAFLTTGCTTCSHFWSVFAGLAPEDLPGDRTDLVVVTRGDDHEHPARVRDLAPPQHLVIRSTMAWYDYGVEAGPYFVLVDGRTDVVLGEGTAGSWAEIDQLLRRAVGAPSPGIPSAGAPSPGAPSAGARSSGGPAAGRTSGVAE